MKELFEQNKLLFLAVITILIAVFLIKKLISIRIMKFHK